MPTQSLQAAIAQLQTYALTLAGVKTAPAYAPDGVGPFPFVVSYPGEGEWTPEDASGKRNLHRIKTEIHVARAGDLPKALEAVIPYNELFGNKICANPTLAGTVATVVFPITYTFGPMAWGGVQTIGYRFTIPIKIRSAIT